MPALFRLPCPPFSDLCGLNPLFTFVSQLGVIMSALSDLYGDNPLLYIICLPLRPFSISVVSILDICLPARGNHVRLFPIPVLSILYICLPAHVMMSALFRSWCSQYITFVSQLGWRCPPFSEFCAFNPLDLSPSMSQDINCHVLSGIDPDIQSDTTLTFI